MSEKEKIKEIEKEKKKWEDNELKSYLGNNPERKKKFYTNSGQEIKRVYTPADLEDTGFDYLKDLGFPGGYPYTRGITPSMYRSQFWNMSQYSGFGTAEDTNKRYKFLLKQGQKANSVAFDLPTQLGLDSDSELAQGEAGKVGVAVDSLRDMEILFDGIPIGEIRQSMTINATAAIILAMFIAVAEKQGIPQENIETFLQNDILKEYIARGAYIFPVEPSMKLVTDVIEYVSKYMPKSSPQRICGYHIRESGADAIQELAFTLSNAIAYLNAAIKRGLDVDDFARGLLIFLSGDREFFEEIAKFRACRRMWAKMLKERFGAKDPKSMQIRYFGYTSGSTMTAQQPLNNVIRVAIEALAMVLGGGQFVYLSSYDESLALPTEESVTVALRTQQIIANETGVADTVDPLAGSYYVESLTNNLEKGALKYIKEIDDMGGSVAAIEKGYIQEEISSMAYRKQKEMESGERVVVGVNEFVSEKGGALSIMKVDPEVQKRQIERTKRVRQERDGKKVKAALGKVKEVAEGNDNIVPCLIDAVKAYATIGEICDILRGLYGRHERKIYF